MWCECTHLSCWVVRSGSGELLGCGRDIRLNYKTEQGSILPKTYYHVESVLQKILERQDHPLLIVSIFIYNNSLVFFFIFSSATITKSTVEKLSKMTDQRTM